VWCNFHTHSDFCDGKSSLEDCAAAAVAKGVISLGYSSHAPLPFATKWAMPAERFPEYLDQISSIQRTAEIEIYKGLEVDFISGKTGPAKFRPQLDFTIGSVHFTDADSSGAYLEIDGLHTEFLKRLETVYQNDIRAAVTRYYELTREMLATDCPDVLGHMDKIKIQNIENEFFSEGDSWYRDVMEQTVKAIRSSGVIVEVNTRGVYKKKTGTTYPSEWVVQMLFNQQVPVTLSSDAHHPDDLINYFPATAAMLRRIGYTHLMCLRKDRWQPLDFDEHGIKA
jgi:histidinol-phosphatase (PHP family)